MEILTVSKGETISTDEIKRLFKTSEDLEELKEKIEKAKDRLFIGWDTVEIRDREDEKIPIDEYLIRKYEVYVNERNGSISDTHTSKIIGQTLDYKPMRHPKTGEMAILTLNKIFNNYKIDDKVWKEIQSGDRIGLSVAGESHKQENKIEANKPIKEIKEMDVLEKASISPDSNPCNPEALNIGVSQIAKSEGIHKQIRDTGERNRDTIAKDMFGKLFNELSDEQKWKVHTRAINGTQEKTKTEEIDKGFGKWESFEHCVRDNQDADHPEALCAWMEHTITGKWPAEKTIKKALEKRVGKKLDNLKEKLDKIS